MNHDVHQILLQLPSEAAIEFHAGQYLQLVTSDGEASAFSIASSPAEVRANAQVELHLRAFEGNLSARRLLEQIADRRSVDVRLPYGDCFLASAPALPLILLAGSTGFAQARAILRDLLDRDHPGEIHLYWGGRTPADLYSEEPVLWQQTHDQLTYHPVISDTDSDARGGLVHESVLEDFDDLSDTLIVASGSPPMVYAALDDFTAHGARKENVLSDVFAYAPRQGSRSSGSNGD